MYFRKGIWVMRTSWMVVLLVAPALNAAPLDATPEQVLSATANLAYISRDGCVQNEISIFVNQTIPVPNKAGAVPGKTEVTYLRTRFDFCEGVDLGLDRGSSRAVTVTGDLKRLRLDGAIDGTDGSQGSTRVTFSIAWTGMGEIHRVTHPSGAPNAKGAARPDTQSRSAIVDGRVEGEEVSEASIGSILLTIRHTKTR
jgi:hypothetical protein